MPWPGRLEIKIEQVVFVGMAFFGLSRVGFPHRVLKKQVTFAGFHFVALTSGIDWICWTSGVSGEAMAAVCAWASTNVICRSVGFKCADPICTQLPN